MGKNKRGRLHHGSPPSSAATRGTDPSRAASSAILQFLVTLVAKCVKTGFRLMQFKEDFDIMVQLEGGKVFRKVLNEKCRIKQRK